MSGIALLLGVLILGVIVVVVVFALCFFLKLKGLIAALRGAP